MKLGWMSTGRGQGSRKLLLSTLQSIKSGYIDAQIECVFCNRAVGEEPGSDQFMSIAESNLIPVVAYSSREFTRRKGARSFNDVRAEYDRCVIEMLSGFKPDLIVLAGYMLFTSLEMVTKFKMINLHPAPPEGPIGPWQEIIWEIIKCNSQLGGVQIQLATMDWDRGPIISYITYPLTGTEFGAGWKQINEYSFPNLRKDYDENLLLFKTIREETGKREIPLLVETLRSIANNDIKIRDGAIFHNGKILHGGLSLADRIPKWLT